MRPVFIYGTRPEANKISGVVNAMTTPSLVICTDQHKDLLEGQGSLDPDVHLDIPFDTHPMRWALHAGLLLKPLIQKDDLVIVQGDTSTVSAGASAAVAAGARVAHIEAGVRSFGPEPWPEEQIRVDVTSKADFHFACTDYHVENLLKEVMHKERRIFKWGNPGISYFLEQVNKVDSAEERVVLITLHRRELRSREDIGEILDRLYEAIASYPDQTFLWPVHPGFAGANLRSRVPDNLTFTGPMDYPTFVSYLRNAQGVITDSGGVVEEASFLGIPTAILRDYNDRQEAVDYGPAIQCKPSKRDAPEGAVHYVMNPQHTRPFPYGNAESASLIATELDRLCKEF